MDNQPFTANAIREAPSVSLTAHDYAILNQAEGALDRGLTLQKWWQETHAHNRYAERFETVTTFNRPDYGFAYFDQAPLHGRFEPVLGDVMDLFYDRPKLPNETGAAQWMQAQVREYVFRYFTRISDFRRPQASLGEHRHTLPAWLRPLSLCPEDTPQRQGFGYSQYYYKLRGSGQYGKFPESDRLAIIDLRDLYHTYEWIVLKVRIFDFNLTLSPFGSQYPWVELPLQEEQWVVISRDFLVDEEGTEPSVLGTYGYGYAVFKDPAAQSLLAYGPGQFDFGFQLFHFRVLDSGEVRVQLVFLVNRPAKVLNLPLNPLAWGTLLTERLSFGAAAPFLAPLRRLLTQLPLINVSIDPVLPFVDTLNFASAGLAEREFCISREDLEKLMLAQHYVQNYDLIEGSLLTWRQIPNWLASDLPSWVTTGVSS